MKKAYNVKAAGENDLRETIVVAESQNEAMEKVIASGMEPIEVKLNLEATFSLLMAGDLNPRELAQFYFTLGRRVGAGMEITRAVREAAEFSRDVAVRVVLSNLADEVDRGLPVDEAMKEAGLPQRDWSLIGALGGSGKMADALTSLGRDYNRRSTLKTRIRGLIFEPAGFMLIVYLLAYGGLTYLAPRIEGFFEKLSTIEMPPLAQKVYGFADLFNAHIEIATILYVALGVGIVAVLRTQWTLDMLDKIPIVRTLSERADHAGLWSVFGMLYASATRRDAAAQLTASTAFREDSHDAFMQLSDRLQRGQELSEAVKEVEFPPWVRSSVANAFSAGGSSDVVESLELFTDNLAADVEMLTERLSVMVRAVVTSLMGFAVLGLAFITVVPMVQSALSAA